MNDEEKTKDALENLQKEPVNNMPEGLEVFEPGNEGFVKNINQQDDQEQFVAKDIGYSQNTEEKKNERYTGPVTQAHYDTGETSQSFNSSNTVVHKSHATRNKKLFLLVLLIVIAVVAGGGYYLSNRDKSPSSSTVQQEVNEVTQDNSYTAKSGRDNERKKDINTIYQKLEEYFNEFGFYPSELNPSSLSGIETESMVDPIGNPIDSKSPQTEITPPVSPYKDTTNLTGEASQYTYQPYSCTSSIDGAHCSKYLLSTWLESTTETYEKNSLN